MIPPIAVKVPLISFVLVFLGSVLLVRAGLAIARHIGFIARPNPIVKSHTTSIALGGGVVIMIVGLVAIGALQSGPQRAVYVWPLLITLVVGIVDDAVALTPIVKLAGQVIAAGTYVTLARPDGLAIVPIVVLLVAAQNAWNLIDVMDGLAGSVSVLAFLGIAALSVLTGASESILLTASIAAGAFLGFLVWNRPPARIYLGDAGSLSAGLLFGILIVELAQKAVLPGLMALSLGAIPFFEMSFLMMERRRKRIPIYHGSPDHFALRLQCAGWSRHRVLLLVIAVQVVLIVLCIGAAVTPAAAIPYVAPVLLALILIGGLAAYRCLRKLPTWGEQKNA